VVDADPGPAPPLTWSTLDRAAHRRIDPAWLAEAWPRAQVLVVEAGRVLVADGRLLLVPSAQAPEGERLFLGVDAADRPYFAVVAAHAALGVLADGATAQGLREVGHRLGELDAALMMTGVSLANWHASHRFSPASGLATEVRDSGWSRVDASGAQLWPRTDPAVIVLVHDAEAGPQGRCLLGRNVAWSRGTWGAIPRYSCLAGFVEPGESAEQTVVREVAEEVGVAVRDVHYVASQPWPYPGSLMLGFHAQGDPHAPLHPDPAEIADARWFTRAEIEAAEAGDTSVGFGLPTRSSIAHYLIMQWLSRRA
jgi:NAD+ diphosphatase